MMLAVVTPILAALLAAQSQPAPKPEPVAPLKMNGCVARDYTDAKSATSYTFIDDTDGSRYHITGKSVSKYSGMSVHVVGSLVDTRKLKVAGGLWPSPNVAGQAGNIDVGQAAIAALPGGTSTGTGNVELPTLKVTQVSLGGGECKQ